MSASSDGDLEQLWHQVADAVGRASPFTRSYLLEAHPVLFDRNLLTIGFDPEFADHLQLVDNAKNRTLIQTKLSEFGFADAQVKFVKAEARVNRLRPTESPVEPAAPSATAAAAPAAPKGAEEAVPSQGKREPGPGSFNQEDFKNDPLIQKALEIFKGQIIEVRA